MAPGAVASGVAIGVVPAGGLTVVVVVVVDEGAAPGLAGAASGAAGVVGAVSVVVVVVVDESAGAAVSPAGCSAVGSTVVVSSCLLQPASVIAKTVANKMVLFISVAPRLSM